VSSNGPLQASNPKHFGDGDDVSQLTFQLYPSYVYPEFPWYEETNLCLRSKASSVWALTDHHWRVRRARRALWALAKHQHGAASPARQITLLHNWTFVLASRHLRGWNLTSDPPHSRQFSPAMTSHELDLTSPTPRAQNTNYREIETWEKFPTWPQLSRADLSGVLTSVAVLPPPVSEQSLSEARELVMAGQWILRADWESRSPS